MLLYTRGSPITKSMIHNTSYIVCILSHNCKIWTQRPASVVTYLLFSTELFWGIALLPEYVLCRFVPERKYAHGFKLNKFQVIAMFSVLPVPQLPSTDFQGQCLFAIWQYLNECTCILWAKAKKCCWLQVLPSPVFIKSFHDSPLQPLEIHS